MSNKPTPERDLFRQIWKERRHRSEVSGKDLGNEMNSWFFSHILPKSIYGEFRLNKENIVLMTMEEHMLWEHRKSLLESLPKWAWVLALREKLIKQYNKVTP